MSTYQPLGCRATQGESTSACHAHTHRRVWCTYPGKMSLAPFDGTHCVRTKDTLVSTSPGSSLTLTLTLTSHLSSNLFKIVNISVKVRAVTNHPHCADATASHTKKLKTKTKMTRAPLGHEVKSSSSQHTFPSPLQTYETRPQQFCKRADGRTLAFGTLG